MLLGLPIHLSDDYESLPLKLQVLKEGFFSLQDYYQPLQFSCWSKNNSVHTVDSQALNTSLQHCPIFLLTLLNLLPKHKEEYSFAVLNATPHL